MDIYHFDMENVDEKDLIKVILGFRKEECASSVAELIMKGLYQKVAIVETENLDKAFELTNHIDCDWRENKGVTALKLMNRSSSVGDIFVLNNEAYLIESIGFEKLPIDTVANLESNNCNSHNNTSKKLKM
jgi:hypothetical protein